MQRSLNAEWEVFYRDNTAALLPVPPQGPPLCEHCGRRWVGRLMARRPLPLPGDAEAPRSRSRAPARAAIVPSGTQHRRCTPPATRSRNPSHEQGGRPRSRPDDPDSARLPQGCGRASLCPGFCAPISWALRRTLKAAPSALTCELRHCRFTRSASTMTGPDEVKEGSSSWVIMCTCGSARG
ncbi:hypothetical protein GCM10010104_25660 [Streptomyces indiaensis]|uniref:Uncharacterized protein n=1 Tax=Streptomyces indiaensis TaxID=284033 RepID=A0ABN3DH29_9ACTN